MNSINSVVISADFFESLCRAAPNMKSLHIAQWMDDYYSRIFGQPTVVIPRRISPDEQGINWDVGLEQEFSRFIEMNDD